MKAFRTLLGSEYSTSFPDKEAGDAHSFYNFLNTMMKAIDYKSFEIDNPVNKALNINYLFSRSNDEGEIDTNLMNEISLFFNVNKVIPAIEQCNLLVFYFLSNVNNNNCLLPKYNL